MNIVCTQYEDAYFDSKCGIQIHIHHTFSSKKNIVGYFERFQSTDKYEHLYAIKNGYYVLFSALVLFNRGYILYVELRFQ